MAALAGATIENRLFSLQLEDDWKQTCFNRHENQYCFNSPASNANLLVSGIEINGKPGTLNKLAEATLKYVIDREQREHSRGGATIEKQWIEPLPGAMALRVNYVGHDITGRSFRYAGIVSEKKLISLYIEMPAASARGSEDLLESILRRLRA
jgi:hypothetical protein